jgi:hypothetical protein
MLSLFLTIEVEDDILYMVIYVFGYKRTLNITQNIVNLHIYLV